MRITKDDIAQRYQHLNETYFEGMLPKKIRFGTFQSWNTLGLCHYKPKRKSCSCISIASNVDWSEESLTDVILHEMIHLHLDLTCPRYNNRNWRYRYWSHGGLFRKEVRRLRKQGATIHTGKRYKMNYEPFLCKHRGKTPPHTLVGKLNEWLYVQWRRYIW